MSPWNSDLISTNSYHSIVTVTRDYLGDIIHALELTIQLPVIGNEEISELKELVFFSNCSRAVESL